MAAVSHSASSAPFVKIKNRKVGQKILRNPLTLMARWILILIFGCKIQFRLKNPINYKSVLPLNVNVNALRKLLKFKLTSEA